MKKKYFLVTTSLEEFWDPEQPLLFLGAWCLRFDRRSYWTLLDGHQVESYLHDAAEAHITYRRIDDVYERILPIVAEALNTIHKTQYSLRYWRLVVGPWLHRYLTGVYDRFERIMCALQEFPDLTTTVLSEKSFVVPQDTNEFNRRFSEDMYNLQIYSKILWFLGKKFPEKAAQQEPSLKFKAVPSRSWKQNLFSTITDVYRFLVIKLVSHPIVISNSYFPKVVELRLFVKLFGGIFTTRGMKQQNMQYQYDNDLRKTLKHMSFGDDAFSKCLSDMLFSDIPKCFVEGYKSIVELGKKKYPSSPKMIFSANSWWCDEVFKCWAANCAENGILLLGTAHGGNYGTSLDMPNLKHETKIVDYYYSWGWGREDCHSTIIPMPAPKLMDSKNVDADNDKSGILWATTVVPRYVMFGFPLTAPELYQEYLLWHKRFALSLSNKVLPAIYLRAHPLGHGWLDHGWNVLSRIKEYFPNLRLDSPKKPFLESIGNCRLFVCDHLSTAYVEALAINKPTILFWSPETNKLTPEAEQYFELLRSVGVLFDSPEAAAEAVNNVYGDVESWWNDPERQKAVSVFRDKFCRRSPDATHMWAQEFRRMAFDKP
jgi:putative transferase (TIGR04331 family)